MDQSTTDTGHHKTTTRWAERAMVTDLGYVPVDESGKVDGFQCCLAEARAKVCEKRRNDYVKTSQSRADKLPIWC